MNNAKDKKGRWTKQKMAQDMHGVDFKGNDGMVEKLLQTTEKAMTQIGTSRAQKAFKSLSNTINFQSDFAEIYSPSQNFIEQDASGGDAYAESGRVPLDDLIAMTQFRTGWANRATFGSARNIYRNGYEFVPLDFDIDTKAVEQKEVKKWMDDTDYFSFRVNHLYRDRQAGLGIGIPIYPGDTKEKMMEPYTGKERPIRMKAYSPWHLTPTSIVHYELGDYDKKMWDFRGGIDSTLFHHSRVTLLETRPEPYHLRGLAVLEPIWTAAMCYFNAMIFVLKSLAQVGVMSVGIQSPNEFPTKNEAQSYLDMLNSFRANKFYVLGAGATLVTQNMAGQIGKGLNDFLEFLKEDISAALVIPKNQLFGRSEGGGLSGAGALVSKDDWLSALMTEALDMTSEELAFLKGPCRFEKHLEGLTLRWRLDLHKTEMERLEEESVRMDMEMKRLSKVQAEKQMKMNGMLLDAQMKEVKADPKAFLDKMNTEVEQNTEGDVKNTPDGKPKQENKPKQPKNDFYNIDYHYGNPLSTFRARKVDEGL